MIRVIHNSKFISGKLCFYFIAGSDMLLQDESKEMEAKVFPDSKPTNGFVLNFLFKFPGFSRNEKIWFSLSKMKFTEKAENFYLSIDRVIKIGNNARCFFLMGRFWYDDGENILYYWHFNGKFEGELPSTIAHEKCP